MHIDANFLTVALAIGGVLATIASMFIDSKIDKALKVSENKWNKEFNHLEDKVNWLEKKVSQLSTHTGFGIDSFIKGRDEL